MTIHKNPFALFDKLDYQIIKKLQENSRLSAKKIADELAVNDRTVRKRIDRMIEMGIGRFALILEPSRFGYAISVDIFLEIDLEKEESIIPKLLDMPQVSYLAFGQGTNELSLEARFKSSDLLYDFLWKVIPNIDGVKVTKYTLVPRILKNLDEWTPAGEDFAE